MTLPDRPKLSVVVPLDKEPRLAVRLDHNVRASNQQEFNAGTVAGFVPASAVSMVLHGKGKALLFEDTAEAWGEALRPHFETPGEMLDVCVGQLAVDMKARFGDFEAAFAARKAEEAKAEAERVAAQLIVDQQRADAEKEATEKAALEASEKAAKEAAAIEAMNAETKRRADEGLARASADVSNPDVSGDAMANKQPAPTPPPAEPATRRGNRTPRGA